jgi:hypothetical protein
MMPTVSPVSRDADSRFEIESSRPRQTVRPPAPFRDVLAGSVGLLLTGAEVATQVVAGPVLAAAVHDARVGAATVLGPPAASLPRSAPFSAGSVPIGSGTIPGAQAPSSGTSELSNTQLLGLQQQIQQENQRFTTLSNVMRAKHDTAKAAVSNIRA